MQWCANIFHIKACVYIFRFSLWYCRHHAIWGSAILSAPGLASANGCCPCGCTVKPVFKGHLYIREKVSLHDRCPFITGSLTWGR